MCVDNKSAFDSSGTDSEIEYQRRSSGCPHQSTLPSTARTNGLTPCRHGGPRPRTTHPTTTSASRGPRHTRPPPTTVVVHRGPEGVRSPARGKGNRPASTQHACGTPCIRLCLDDIVPTRLHSTGRVSFMCVSRPKSSSSAVLSNVAVYAHQIRKGQVSKGSTLFKYPLTKNEVTRYVEGSRSDSSRP